LITITNTITIAIVIAIAIAAAIITISHRLNAHTYARNRWEAGSRFRWKSEWEICSPQVRIAYHSCRI
jgi:hypothetical protein